MGLRNAFLRAVFGRAAATRLGVAPETGMSLAQIVPGIRSLPPKRGTRDFLAAYSDSPWLRAVVAKIAQGVSHVPWEVFHTEHGRRFPLPVHPLLDLLARGNAYMTGLEVRRLTQIHLELVGEAFWVLERNQYGWPQDILPVPPHWVLDVPNPARRSFNIQVPNGFHGEVAEEDVVWFRDPDPLRPYERGSGIAMALAEEFDADEAARRHIAAFLSNRARPDLIVTGAKDTPFTRDDAERLEASWSQRHQGPEKSGRPMFLPGHVAVQEIGHAPKDLEMVQIRQQERDIIVSTFGIPPEKLGILTSSNRASIEAADLFFAKDVLAPRLALIRETLQQRLMGAWGEVDLEIDFQSPIAADKDFERSVAAAAPWSRTVDEWRRLQGLGPLPDGAGEIFPLPPGLTFSKSLETPAAGSPPPPEAPLPRGEKNNFNPDQPRDEHGRWTDGSGISGADHPAAILASAQAAERDFQSPCPAKPGG